MPVLLVLIAAALGWALWTGRIKLAQLPPILLALAGAFLLVRGQWMPGAGAIAVGATWYRGLTWRMFGLNSKQSPEYHLANARALLGVAAHDDAERIKARHRVLIAQNHPDRGGSDDRASELNKARDMLLDDLERKSG
jgi:hypothetical protein